MVAPLKSKKLCCVRVCMSATLIHRPKKKLLAKMGPRRRGPHL